MKRLLVCILQFYCTTVFAAGHDSYYKKLTSDYYVSSTSATYLLQHQIYVPSSEAPKKVLVVADGRMYSAGARMAVVEVEIDGSTSDSVIPPKISRE